MDDQRVGAAGFASPAGVALAVLPGMGLVAVALSIPALVPGAAIEAVGFVVLAVGVLVGVVGGAFPRTVAPDWWRDADRERSRKITSKASKRPRRRG
ncbi:hypothetical protein [Solicola sp. PLA-1-18]|uniref:hypothetical protein n=1 Tax=Solicola sp. PLA-1-18 TaxID=3380532 RepID=UPI003B7A2D51